MHRYFSLKNCALIFLVLGIGGIGYASFAFSDDAAPKGSEALLEEIASEQQRVLAHVEKPLALGHEYIKKDEADLLPANLKRKLTHNRDFWNETFRQVYWQNVLRDGQDSRGFTILLNLTPEATVVKGHMIHSETMAATVLLNHVFSHLDALGYKTQGTPGVVISAVQYATNTWHFERKAPNGQKLVLTVTGEVFLSRGDKQAILKGEILCQIKK